MSSSSIADADLQGFRRETLPWRHEVVVELLQLVVHEHAMDRRSAAGSVTS